MTLVQIPVGHEPVSFACDDLAFANDSYLSFSGGQGGSIAASLRGFEEENAMQVQELMTRDPIAVSPSDRLAQAAGKMWEHDCGSLPVTDNGVVVGMITDRDICMATWSRGRSPDQIDVGEAMSLNVVSCKATDSVKEVERKMSASQVRRLPVLDDRGSLVGVISLADLVQRKTGDDIGHTLAGICQRSASHIPVAAQIG